jgi:hypothetical protein
MKVYLHATKETQQPVFQFNVNPSASGFINESDVPSAWKGKEFKLAFAFGECEVDDTPGLWLLKHQMVHDRAGTAPKLDLKKMIRGWR